MFKVTITRPDGKSRHHLAENCRALQDYLALVAHILLPGETLSYTEVKE